MKYWAFISYSSHDAKRWALPLRKRLEAYRIPQSLVGKVVCGETIPARLTPVFRDRDELAAGPDLPDRIRAALEASRYLIVVCSPHSQRSQYVGLEIQWFKQLGRSDRVIAYIVDGEPAECFRDELIYDVDPQGQLLREAPKEPLAADARPGRDGKDALLKVVAGIVGASFDDLKRRELQRRQRILLGVTSLTACIALLLMGLAVWAMIERNRANLQTVAAQQNEQQANLARQGEATQRAQAVQRLVRMLVADGWRAFNQGDALSAAPLFVQALEADDLDSQAEQVHRLRIAATLRRCPRLTQVWFPGSYVGGAAFHPEGRLVLTTSGNGMAQTWDVESGEAVGKPLRSDAGFSGGLFSPDGQRILTWSAGSKIGGAQLWDAATGEPLGAPMQTKAHVQQAQFSSDGAYLKLNLVHHSGGGAVQGTGYSIAIHDGATGEPVSLPGMGEGSLHQVLFAVTAPRVLIVSHTGNNLEAQVWDFATQQPVGPAFRPGYDPRVQLNDSGDRILVLGSENVQVWDSTTGEHLGPTIHHGRRIVSAALSPDGQHVATVSEHEMFLDGTRPLKPAEAQVWDVETGDRVGEPLREEHDITSVFFAAAGDQVVTLGKTQARVWDVSSSQPRTPPLRHRHGLSGVRISTDARRVLTWGQDGSVRLWDLAVTDELCAIRPEGPLGGSRVHFGDTRRVEMSPDDRRLLVNVMWSARTWDPQTAMPLTDYRVKDLAIGVARFSPNGQYIAGGGSLRTQQEPGSIPAAYVWDTASGDVVAGPLVHDGPPLVNNSPAVQSLAFHPSGRILATGAQDGTVRLWDIAMGHQLGQSLAHRSDVQLVAFTADGSRLLSMAHSSFGDSGEVHLWDPATGKDLSPQLELPRGVRLAAISRNGERLVVGAGSQYGPRGDTTGTSSVVEVRRLPDGARLGRPVEVGGSLQAVAIDPSESRFLAAWDNSIRVYDVETGEAITPVLDHADDVAQARFIHGGRLIYACCGRDFNLARKLGEVRIWDAETGDLAAPPLRHLLPVRSADVDSTESVLAAGGEDFVRLWDLSADKRPVEDLRLLARLLSEMEIDARSHVNVLAPADYQATWEKYQQRNPAARRGPAAGQVLAWHAREAMHAEAAEAWRTADRHLTALLASSTHDQQLLARRGFARFHLKDWQESAVCFGRSLELGNGEWNVRYHRGRALAEQQKWQEAIPDYDTVLEEVQAEWDVYYQRGRAYYQLDKYDRAEADCTRAIAVLGGQRPEFSLNPQFLEQQALVQLHNGKWHPWFLRGLARQNSAQYQLAVQDYSQVVEANPEHLWARCNRGICQRMLDRYDEALADFTAVIDRGLDDWRPWNGRAWIAAHCGDWSNAASDYAQALSYDPDRTEVWTSAALVCLQQGDKAGYKAICAAMHKQVADGPLGARLQTALVCILAADGVDDWQSLRLWCDEGQSQGRKNTGVLLGAVLYRQGQFELARTHLQSVAAEDSGLHGLIARAFVAMALHRLGLEKEAAAELEEMRRIKMTIEVSELVWTDRLLTEFLRREAEERCTKKE